MIESHAADAEYVTQSDTVPEFFNYVRSLHADDLVAELLQNEIDAGSTHTVLEFGSDRLICRGNGAPIDADGWARLKFLRGAGDEVPQKKGLIGIKNHGLKACFTIGDTILVRSGGLKTDQTLYKHGEHKPPIRPRHLIELRHHRFGTTSFSFATTRTIDKGKFQIFSRTCEIEAPDGQRIVRERVITRTIARPHGVQHDVPDFYARKARLVIELAWAEGPRGRILAEPGELRYPIGYTLAGPETRSGFAVHYSAPFASDTERHGLAGQSSAWNLHLRTGCDALLVDAIAWLLNKADLRPLDLLGIEDSPQDRLVSMTIALAEHRALPSIPPHRKGGSRGRPLRRRWRRILIPSTKAAPAIHSEALADSAPAEDWLLAPETPGRLRALLVDRSLAGWCENRVSFDETDVLARLRPIGADEDAYFPWRDDTERRRSLSKIPLVRRYLDALMEGAPPPEPEADVELPDGRGVPAPLANMSLASDLPIDLPGIVLPPLLHPALADHALFRTSNWHRPHFGFPELVDTVTRSPIDAAVARRLFLWLARNPNGFPKRSWPAIRDLPIWPDLQDGYGPLGRLCEPKNGALARVLCDTIARPHADIARLRTSLAARRLSLGVRTEPEGHEISAWLAKAFASLPIGRPLDDEELLRFRKAERDLELVAQSPSGKLLAGLTAPPALARDGTLMSRADLVAPSTAVDRMALLPGHVARSRLEATCRVWPMPAAPSAGMVYQALHADPRNAGALLPRLKALSDATAGLDLGVSQLACIPLGGEFVAPGTLAFKGNRGDCWGAYRRQISGKNLAPADQALYRRAGVFPAEPNPEASRVFFDWLNDDSRRIEAHLPQIIRQFAHDRGPTSWWATYDGVPCLPVTSARGVQLVSHRTAIRGRSVFVPDFRPLAQAIAHNPGQIMLAIDKHEDVVSSIAQVLLQQGVRSLRRVAGDPLRATGADPRPAPAWVEEIIATLKSNKIARTLEKRLDDLQVSKEHLHSHWGRQAEAAVERAREQVAAAVNGDPAGVVFTSNATEAANIVLRSFAGPGRRMLISAIEHPCVEETAAACHATGTAVERIVVDEEGLIDLDQIADRLEGCDLASVMAVNNEVGTIQPVDAVATLCRSAGVPFHTDAAQALGRVDIDMTTGISFATLSAHKAYGPQGIGAICADPSLLPRLRPLTSGGGQQNGIRPGTLPVALCVGFGRACELAKLRQADDNAHCADLSRHFLERLAGATSRFALNGAADERVPHNLNISFEGVEADDLLALLPEMALSTGSACSSGAIAPSRVLSAMGLPERTVRSAIRIGFGRTTQVEEVTLAADRIGAAVRRLRGE